jgi:hypothetical protein
MPISLSEFAHILEEGPKLGSGEILGDAMVSACKLVRRKARGMIGVEQPIWPGLAESTIQDKRRHGYPVPKPLLRTGEMRDSIEIDAPHWESPGVCVGYVFSNNPIARYQEMGTMHIPPRPFLSTAAMACEPQVHQMFATAALREHFKAWHLLKQALDLAWDGVKELAETDEDDGGG